MWQTGPYQKGAVQFADAADISFTGNGSELIVNESRCPRSRYRTNCSGHSGNQVRVYSPATEGGSLEGGQVLFRSSELTPAGTSLSDAYITPDGSALNTDLLYCPRRGACTLRVARISVLTGRVQRVLYQTSSGTAFEGIFDRFFVTDPSGRYLILDAGQGSARVNGWIDHGRLVPLTPANGNAVGSETW